MEGFVMSPKANRAVATRTSPAGRLALELLGLVRPRVTRRIVRSTPGVRHVRVVVRRLPDLRPRQPRSVAIAGALLGAYLRAATAAKHPNQ